MKIAYYMPFKPPGHANPSGDLITGRELREFLTGQGHQVELVSSLRSRWIYLKPHQVYQYRSEIGRICGSLQRDPTDLWLTYHTYYKAPDLLGPACSKKLRIPYVIFQGIYSTKRRRNLKTLPGFFLNRKALSSAQMVYTNKKKDEKNLHRLLPQKRILYIAPGIRPDLFSFDPEMRLALRKQWQVGDRQVILSTAMLRPGVKTEGISQVIQSCGDLHRSGHKILLVVIGDGQNRQLLEDKGRQQLGSSCLFLGKIERSDLFRYYSAADLFAFPGIQESLGMVYLEAQSTGLPVVACGDWGASEAVVDGQTGILTPASRPEEFTASIRRLLTNPDMRTTMGDSAKLHIRSNHDLLKNYLFLSASLEEIADKYRQDPGTSA
ncbi:MAG: glycosyltransferase family 4 protein [Desulfocapsaceae bacterium]